MMADISSTDSAPEYLVAVDEESRRGIHPEIFPARAHARP